MALGAQRQALAGEFYLEAVTEADEGKAREPLATLDALQEEARIESSQFREGRDWRIEVACDVERSFQNVTLEAIKNPSRFAPEMGSGSEDRLLLSDSAQHPTPSGARPPPAGGGESGVHCVEYGEARNRQSRGGPAPLGGPGNAAPKAWDA
jgi:hypothetical protein